MLPKALKNYKKNLLHSAALLLFLVLFFSSLWVISAITGFNGSWVVFFLALPLLGLAVFLLHLYYSVIRKHFPQYFPVTIRVNPFLIANNDFPYDGAAVGALIGNAISRSQQVFFDFKERKKLVWAKELQSTPLSIQFGGATVTADYIVNKIRNLIFGEPNVIEGVIRISNNHLVMHASCFEANQDWVVDVDLEKNPDPLHIAVLRLVNDMRSTYQQFQGLTDAYELRQQYTMAIEFCKELDIKDRGTRLADLLYLAGDYFNAIEEYHRILYLPLEKSIKKACLGLAKTELALGHFDTALDYLSRDEEFEPDNELYIEKNLEIARILGYMGSYEEALVRLKELEDEVIDELFSYDNIQVDDVNTFTELDKRIYDLKEEDFQSVRNLLWSFAQISDQLANCHENMKNEDQHMEYRELSSDLYELISRLNIDDHNSLLQLAACSEKLDYLETATDQYLLCKEITVDVMRKDPENIGALIDMAWASTGIVACAVKMLDRVISEQADDCAEKLIPLLAGIREDKWKEVRNLLILYSNGMPYILEGKIPNHPEVCALISDFIKNHEPSFVRDLLEKVYWTSMLNNQCKASNEYFQKLVNNSHELSHRGEGYYGLSCLAALLGHENEALYYLEKALESNAELRNRLVFDDDFHSIRQTKKFKELAAWQVQG